MEYMAEFEAAYNNGYKQGLKDAAKYGKWIDISGLGNWRCSNCHIDFVFSDKSKNKYHFCPNCGAKMDGEG